MKNIKFFLLSLIAVTLLFSACSDLSKDSSDSQKKSQYTVLGSLSFAGVSRAVYSRTATTAFSDEPVWTISATKGEKSYLPNEVSGLAFNFTFDEAGEYLIEATALKAGKIIAQGSSSCTVSKEGENLANIIAKPVASTLPGSVNLEINLDSYSANKVSSVQVEWLGFVNIDRTKQALGYPSGAELTGDEKEPVISEEVQTAIAALIDWEEQRSEGKFNKTLPVESGKAVIEMGNIFCGAHTVKLSFSDSVGNTLYSCKEILNVYSGFTTNEWYGTAPYLNNGTFTLTSTLVEKYGTEIVPNTDYVLYNCSNGTTQYFLKASPSESVSGTADFTASTKSFCFDANENFYYLSQNGSNYVVNNDTEQLGEFNPQSSGTPSIVVDFATNIMYSWWLGESQLHIRKFSNLISDGDISEQTSYEINSPSITINGDTATPWPKICTIYNGTAYILSEDGGKDLLFLCKAPIKDSSYTLKGADCVEFEPTEIDIHTLLISDMIYQDGAIYILTRKVESCTSRGALIKYDLLTGGIEVIGYSDEVKEKSDLADVKLQAFYSYTEDWETYKVPLYTNEGKSEELIIPANTSFEVTEENQQIFIYNELPSLCTPTPLADSLSEEAFYGPVSFIAIKPKKLVIADDGIAFYTDSEGILKYKNVNRVVTVDLDSFSMDIQNAIVSFNNDYSDVKTGFDPTVLTSYNNALSAYISDSNIAYHDGTGGSITEPKQGILCIPCGD